MALSPPVWLIRPNRKQQAVLVVFLFWVVSLLWSLWSSTPQQLLISTPSDPAFPFHLVTIDKSTHLPSHSLKIRPSGSLSYFLTHLLSHPKADGVFIATNELKSGSILAMKLNRDVMQIVGTSDSGGAEPAFCSVLLEKRLLCSNVSATAPRDT
jgi:hypothetical protein